MFSLRDISELARDPNLQPAPQIEVMPVITEQMISRPKNEPKGKQQKQAEAKAEAHRI